MIRSRCSGDSTGVLATAAIPMPQLVPATSPAAARLNDLVRAHVGFVWRSLRRLGLSPEDADDATQRVLLVFAQKLNQVTPGCERAYLFRTAMRVASKAHRSAQRRPAAPLYDADAHPHRTPDPELLLELRRAREDLDAVLDEMPLELRAAFVLFEIEGCSQPEIAEALGIPKGTVASRLRRARTDFAHRARRHGLIDDEGGLP